MNNRVTVPRLDFFYERFLDLKKYLKNGKMTKTSEWAYAIGLQFSLLDYLLPYITFRNLGSHTIYSAKLANSTDKPWVALESIPDRITISNTSSFSLNFNTQGIFNIGDKNSPANYNGKFLWCCFPKERRLIRLNITWNKDDKNLPLISIRSEEKIDHDKFIKTPEEGRSIYNALDGYIVNLYQKNQEESEILYNINLIAMQANMLLGCNPKKQMALLGS